MLLKFLEGQKYLGEHVFANGCTMSDLIARLAAGATNHGDFVSAVANLTNQWNAQGLITGAHTGAIQSAAARSH